MSRKVYNIHIGDLVRGFFVLLENYPDHPQNLFVFTSFLKGFLRQRAFDETTPTIEVVTILKHERPVIFYHMRKQTEDWIYILTRIDMDVEEAKQRLHHIAN